MTAQVFAPGQTYQLPGGVRESVVSVTRDDDTLDPILVLRPDNGQGDHSMSASEFMELNPESVH